MDCDDDPRVKIVVVMKASRMGITEAWNNVCGKRAHLDPCHILYVQQSLDEGYKYSTLILEPLINDTPVLARRFYPIKSRDRRATTMFRTFPGGSIAITGANSPKGFRMVYKRIVCCDDIDGNEENVGGEGDSVALALKRMATDPDGKGYIISSPTTKDYSQIESWYEKSDQRRFYVPCPHCGEKQTLEFGGKDLDYGLKWKNRDPDTVYYLCRRCHGRIYNYQKPTMLAGGKWHAQAEFKSIAGFQISQLYSFNISWTNIVFDWYTHKSTPQKLQVFINTVLGELYEDRNEKIEDDTLYGRREDYGPAVPLHAAVLTAGVDVQDDRLEVEVVAWGKDEESWNMDYHIIPGNTARPEVWSDLDNFLMQPWQHASGKKLWIACTAIDTGHRSKQVYAFIAKRQERIVSQSPRFIQRLIAIKGSSETGSPVISPRAKKRNKFKIPLYMVGTDTAKGTIYSNATITEAGPGCMHFPFDRDREYFKQLTSEKLFKVYDKNGFPKRVWKKKTSERNEALDTRVYALAALNHLVMNLRLNIDKHLNTMLEYHEAHKDGANNEPGVPREQKAPPKAAQKINPFTGRLRSRGGFARNW